MKNIIILACLLIGLASCKKDKFTTVPQIEYKSVNPQITSDNLGSPIPILTFGITDSEGDFGFKNGKDTAFVYLKNNLTGDTDSLPFPDLQSGASKNFKADVSVSINSVLKCKSLPGGQEHTDTLFFDVYVKDFAKNKSNVITTGDPVLFICQ